MVEREVISSDKMASELAKNFILGEIVFGWLILGISSIINAKVNNGIVNILVNILAIMLIVFCAWKYSTSTSFKKKTVLYEDVESIVKKLLVFTSIWCVFTIAANIYINTYNLDYKIQKAVSEQYRTTSMVTNSLMNSYRELDSELGDALANSIKESQESSRERMISQAKMTIYITLGINCVAFAVAYFGILPFEKKNILNKINKA